MEKSWKEVIVMIIESHTQSITTRIGSVDAPIPLIGIQQDIWKPEDAHPIFEILEKPNWAPWLAASEDSIKGRSIIFPQGQLMLKSKEGLPIASLSTNRVEWNGDMVTLQSWDDYAGDPTTFENTFCTKGNTQILMSMNVHPEYQGLGLARILMDAVKTRAKELGILFLVGSFRPNQFGEFKSINDNWKVDFETYSKMLRPDGLPIDSWLRNLIRNGMKALIVDKKAMTVETSIEEFTKYQSVYNIGKWKEVTPNTWECREVGQWTIKGNTAIYQECNLWGKIPF